MPRRVTHYTPAGTASGLGCPGLLAELEAYNRARVPEGDTWGAAHAALKRARRVYPKTKTDLRKVDCPGCWRSIARMVRERLSE